MIGDLKGVTPGEPHANGTGTINHLRLTVSDIGRAKAFYQPFLHELGYRFVEESGSRLAWASWTPQATLQWVIMSVSNPNSDNKKHDRYSPGLHHVAWNVQSRDEVDRIYKHLSGLGVEILDPPTEYEFEPGYYAFFFSDPDGLKLEVSNVTTAGGLSYWRDYSERGGPRVSPAVTEPDFLRRSCCEP